jgi:hypothetical protein
MSTKENNQAEEFGGDRMRFFSWSQAVVGKLTEENCVRYATEGIEKPIPPDDYHEMPVGHHQFQVWTYTVSAFEKKMLRWEDKSAKAYGIIFRSLSTVLQVGLEKKKKIKNNPHRAWKFLNKTYGTLGITGSFLELQKTMFRNLVMNDDSTIPLFLIEYSRAALDAQIDTDEDLTSRICKMGTLPTRFDNTCEEIITSRLSWKQCQKKLELADERYQTTKLEEGFKAGTAAANVGSTMFVGKDRPRNSRKDRRTTMYEAKADFRGNVTKCFQCSGTHKFWDCPCKHCAVCNKLNAHVAVACPKLSQERKKEWSDWKTSNQI